MLAVLIAKKIDDKIVGGLVPHQFVGGVSIHQYVDDKMIFMEYDLQKPMNMKVILYIFEQLSSLNVNFHKHEISVMEGQKIQRIRT